MFNASTYLGKKKTVGIGAGYDTQSDVAIDSVTGELVDYGFYTVDAFAEYPVGPGSVTAGAAYNTLDLDDAPNTLANERTGEDLLAAVPAAQSQGSGYYAQLGYYINKWQPWVGYEQWDADAAEGAGDWEAFRLGLTYFVAGQNANIKAGYEVLKNDTPGEEDIDTFMVGMYMTY